MYQWTCDPGTYYIDKNALSNWSPVWVFISKTLSCFLSLHFLSICTVCHQLNNSHKTILNIGANIRLKMLPVLQTLSCLFTKDSFGSLHFSSVDTAKLFYSWLAITFSFPCHPCLWHTKAQEKKVKSYAFSPRVYQEKSLSCGCGGLKTEGNESPPAILGCVLRITVLRVKESKREREQRKAVWMIT